MSRARRGHGEGSITQLPDGRWQARVELGWLDGKRRRKAFFGKTRSDAVRKLNRALTEKDRGLPIITDRERVEHFLVRWLEDTVKRSVRPSTYASYASYVHGHLIPGLGRQTLAQLSPQDVQQLLNAKLAAGLSPRSVQFIRAILRRALGQALKWGVVSRNVAALVDPPKVRNREIHPLTPEQVQILLAGIRGERLEALCVTAVATGLRQGELLGLRWQDVDLAQGQLVVRQALQRIDRMPVFVEPKTARSRRTVALPIVAHEVLRSHRAKQLAERLQAGDLWDEWGLVFTTPRGMPLHPSNVTHDFQKVLARLGLPRQRFHDLRHCCASLMLAQGLTLKDVMETLGHSQISLAANLYGHLYAERRQEVARRMDQMLGTGGR
jgi:integrase